MSTARIVDEVLAAVSGADHVRIVAIASRDRERAQSYADEHGIERGLGTYEALLEDSEVEAVYIPLPNSLHIDWTVRALEAGKHVLCEKPLSREPAEVDRAFIAAESAGKLLWEGFMYRHHPQTARVKKLADEERVGTLRALRAVSSFNVFDVGGPSDIRLCKELGGGALMDVGCYCVSGARLVVGEPARVYGEQLVSRSGVDLSFFGTMWFADDVVAQFRSSLAMPRCQELELVGDDARLVVFEPWRVDGIAPPELIANGSSTTVEVEKANSYRLELVNFSAAIRDGAELSPSYREAYGQARTIDALYRSAETGVPVNL
jgi:xylose dehydrogenase (NAD/NADP)